MRTLDEAHLDKDWEKWLAYCERRLHGVQTGIAPIDQYLLGLGGITTLQGETGSNKSTLALQIVHHNLKLGNPCIMLDRENGESRIKTRMMCQANNVSENDIKVAPLADKKRYAKAIRSLPLHIYTETTDKLDVIKQRIAECRDKYKKHTLLLVDSIQAMPSLDPDRALNIEKWMGYFDQLKLDFEGDLTILVTSEINRASYGLEGGLGAGKGSNAIEYKSETLIDMRMATGNSIKALVAKNRDGQKGAVFMLEKQFADPANGASFNFKLDVNQALGGIDV